MGCCQSSFLKLKKPSADANAQDNNNSQHQNSQQHQNGVEAPPPDECVPSFVEFSFADLKTATNNFSSDHIVSETSDSNVVYKGRLQKENNQRCVAVKKFTKAAWPDRKQFAVRTLSPFLLDFSGSDFHHSLP